MGIPQAPRAAIGASSKPLRSVRGKFFIGMNCRVGLIATSALHRAARRKSAKKQPIRSRKRTRAAENREPTSGVRPLDEFIAKLAPFLRTLSAGEQKQFAPDAPVMPALPASLAALERLAPMLATGLPVEVVLVRVRGEVVGTVLLNRRLVESAIKSAYSGQLGSDERLSDDMLPGARAVLLRHLDRDVGPWQSA